MAKQGNTVTMMEGSQKESMMDRKEMQKSHISRKAKGKKRAKKHR